MSDEKFGMLYGNHIRGLIRKRIVVSACRKGAYVLNKKGSYTDSWVIVGSYLETIYTSLWLIKKGENQDECEIGRSTS